MDASSMGIKSSGSYHANVTFCNFFIHGGHLAAIACAVASQVLQKNHTAKTARSRFQVGFEAFWDSRPLDNANSMPDLGMASVLR